MTWREGRRGQRRSLRPEELLLLLQLDDLLEHELLGRELENGERKQNISGEASSALSLFSIPGEIITLFVIQSW